MENTNQRNSGKTDKGLSASFITGAIALAFLVIGYQTALFVHRAAVMKIVSKSAADTVYVIDRAMAESILGRPALSEQEDVSSVNLSYFSEKQSVSNYQGSKNAISSIGKSSEDKVFVKKSAKCSDEKEAVKEKFEKRSYESFRFNPNTVSIYDLKRLGFSTRQAKSIDNYRKKGGRFHRKEDFAKSYVVADSVYKRLEKYIDIPKVDVNKADSAMFDNLPGIGPYFASKMVSYRQQLGGYSYKEQLMDIYHFDEEKFNGLKDLIIVGDSRPYRIWTLPADSLSHHPYIDKYAAKGIVIYRENNSKERWTVKGLANAGIVKPEIAEKLSRCNLAEP